MKEPIATAAMYIKISVEARAAFDIIPTYDTFMDKRLALVDLILSSLLQAQISLKERDT